MAKIDLEKEFLDNRKRKKRAKLMGFISTSLLTGFVIISYLGYTVGQNLANATTVSLDKADKVGLAEIGFRVPTLIPVPDQEKYSLRSDETGIGGEGFVYWTTTTVSGPTIRYIVNHAGYSSDNSVYPATSGRFKKGDPIRIFKEPEVPGTDPRVPQLTEAEKDGYIGFDIIFRIIDNADKNNPVGVENYGIYFNRDIQFYGESDMLNALRLGFESALTSDIISPGRRFAGEIAVGGRLDLDGDGYYDSTLDEARFNPTDPIGYRYEAAYGDFITQLNEDNWGDVTLEDIPENTAEDLTFYNAKTEVGVRPLIDYIPAVAKYSTFKDYQIDTTKEEIDPDAEPLVITDEDGVAEISFRMWLEGWDLSAGDHLRNKTFGANFRFAIAEVIDETGD